MLEVCPTIADGRPACEIHPLGIGGRADPVRLVFDAAPGPAIVAGLMDLGDRFRIVANEVDVVAPPHEPCRACRSRAPSGSRGRTSPPRPRPGSSPAGRTTRCCRDAIGPRCIADFAEMAGIELLLIDETTTVRAFAASSAGTRRTTTSRGGC